MEHTLTSRQAFEAMRRFLELFIEREPPERCETIFMILSSTQILPDGLTADPADWDDWERAVASVIGTDAEGA
jgi:hypothetical protein